MIRILLVDDSPAALALLREGLTGLGDFEVGTANGSTQALEELRRQKPQVLCVGLDLASGVQLTREVMKVAPLPILLLSGGSAGTEQVEEARQAGALEVTTRPLSGGSVSGLASTLRVLAGVKVFARRSAAVRLAPVRPSSPRLVAIGASTGGPQALGRLLRGLESHFPWPILCVQHMSAGFLDGMVAWLRSQTALGVQIAKNGEQPLPGQVYFAPDEHHLKLKSDLTLSVERGEAVDGHRPSATVLLTSVAEALGSNAVGVLLTGMGADGARGLLEMANVGALTMAQDEETSVVFGMPRQAVEMGAVKEAQSLDEIGAQLRSLSEGRRKL